MDWRPHDINVGLQDRQMFCTSLTAGSRQAFLLDDCVCLCHSVRVLTKTEWIHKVRMLAPCKAFLFVFVVVVFSSLENYFGFGTTNLRVKMDHSISLRWNMTFWTFPKRFVFFWPLCIRFVSWFCVQSFAFFCQAELTTACKVELLSMDTSQLRTVSNVPTNFSYIFFKKPSIIMTLSNTDNGH